MAVTKPLDAGATQVTGLVLQLGEVEPLATQNQGSVVGCCVWWVAS